MYEKILITFPGRAGDLLWALPSVRAIAESVGHPVDLQLSAAYGSLAPLLRQQSYLGQVIVDARWAIRETAPMTPWEAPAVEVGEEGGYDRVIHLGYRDWPRLPLPEEVWATAEREWRTLPGAERMFQPWITVAPKAGLTRRVVCGWTDEHFELKVGLTDLVKRATWCGYARADQWHVILPPQSRWVTEHAAHKEAGEDWIKAAQWIANAQIFLGDCSALHVLAVALGKSCVIMEPAEARWHDIFWPLGKTGRVRLVTGNDGRPTFDARHVAEVLREVLDGEG